MDEQFLKKYRDYNRDYIKSFITLLKKAEIGKTTEKREQIAGELFFKCITECPDFNQKHIETIIDITHNVHFVYEEGNIFDTIEKYIGENTDNESSRCINLFLREIAKLNPTGLNKSPNACCGKWELLYRILRPESIQPKTGDIDDNGKKLEIKGKLVRFSAASITGNRYIKESNSAFKDTQFSGNNTITKKYKGKKVFEIEKKTHEAHYGNQFLNNPDEAINAIAKYLTLLELEETDEKAIEESKKIINIDPENYQKRLRKYLLKKFFNNYKDRVGFDRLIIFGEGDNVKFIDNEEDLNKLTITKDYFRIGQDFKIGWYVE